MLVCRENGVWCRMSTWSRIVDIGIEIYELNEHFEGYLKKIIIIKQKGKS